MARTEAQKRYDAKNRDKINAYQRKYRGENVGQFRGYAWHREGKRNKLTPVIDHHHGCCPERKSCQRCRRGLAHLSCNTAIGNAGDDPEKLRRMADNLDAANRQIEAGKAVMQSWRDQPA